jgi:hypothetical protein
MGLYAAQSKAETVFFSRGGVSVCCRLSHFFGVLSYGASKVLGGAGWSPLVGRRWLVAVGWSPLVGRRWSALLSH